MDNQEVIKWLREAEILDLASGNTKDREAVDLAVEALEKQIPRPVKRTVSTKRCGSCGRQLSGIGNLHPERKYCQGCGQAIDWGEDNDESECDNRVKDN